MFGIGDFVEVFVPATGHGYYWKERHCCFGWVISNHRTGVTVQDAGGRSWSIVYSWVRRA